MQMLTGAASKMEDINQIVELVHAIEKEGECPVRYSPSRSDHLIEDAESYLEGSFPNIYISSF
jgi:hypothetical protein